MDSPSSKSVREYVNDGNAVWVVPDYHLEGAYQSSLGLPKDHGMTMILPAVLQTKEQEA